MDELINILGDERVSVASVEKDRRGRNPALDKEQVKKSLEVKNQMQNIATDLEGKSKEERLAWIEAKKTQADAQYKEKSFGPALQTYLEALMGLNEEALGETAVRDLKVRICMNMAMCALENKNPHKALSLADQAAAVDKGYWKPHLKKGVIYERMEEYDLAV